MVYLEPSKQGGWLAALLHVDILLLHCRYLVVVVVQQVRELVDGLVHSLTTAQASTCALYLTCKSSSSHAGRTIIYAACWPALQTRE